MVKRQGSNRWTWHFSYRNFKEQHLKNADDEPAKRERVHVNPDFTVADWRHLAQFAGISYGGTRYTAYGDKAVFVEVTDALPYFPDTLSVNKRQCYWHVKLSTGYDDVVICSFNS